MNDQSPLYVSSKEAAHMLRISESTFRNRLKELRGRCGFPKKDRLVGHYLKADVLAWVSRRRQLADKIADTSTQTEEVRFDEDRL
jgi:predicted DNA-binding transcriptional regulator AlpA